MSIRVNSWLVRPSCFRDLDVTAENQQTNRSHRGGQRKNQPHHRGATFTVFRTERSQHPAAGPDQKFADQKRKVSKRAVRSFLTGWGDGRGIFVNPRRIKRFADGEHSQVQRRHNIVRMNRASEPQITVAERAADHAVCRRNEPVRGQRHDENSRRANNAADNHYAIRRDPLGEGADHRRENNDQNGVDTGQFADRRMQSHLAIAKLRKDIIQLEKDRLQESDEEEKHQQPVECGLADQAMEQGDGIGSAFPRGPRDLCPKSGAIGRLNVCVRNAASPARNPAPKKINHWEKQDLQGETYREELFVRRRLEVSDRQMEIESANEIKNVTGDEITDVHQGVDDRKRDRTLSGRGINPRRRQQNRRAERFTDRQRDQAGHERQPWVFGQDHHAARKRTDRDPEKECSAQADRVGERTGQQREHRHRRRPNPADQRPGCLIAEAEIFRQPQHHRFVGDRVGGVDQQLDQEREPKLALRAAKHGELSNEAAKAARRRRRNDFFGGDRRGLFGYFGHD